MVPQSPGGLGVKVIVKFYQNGRKRISIIIWYKKKKDFALETSEWLKKKNPKKNFLCINMVKEIIARTINKSDYLKMKSSVSYINLRQKTHWEKYLKDSW